MEFDGEMTRWIFETFCERETLAEFRGLIKDRIFWATQARRFGEIHILLFPRRMREMIYCKCRKKELLGK